MIRALFLAAVLLRCPGGGGAANPARLHELDSAERIPAERQPAPHGPQVDTGDLSGDPYSAYPGLGFGPMGPVARSAVPNDATLRSLSSSSNDGDDGGSGQQQLDSDSQQIAARSADDDAELSPKPEYHIISVEFPRVETPFVIGIWIFFASIAKIGESRRDSPAFVSFFRPAGRSASRFVGRRDAGLHFLLSYRDPQSRAGGWLICSSFDINNGIFGICESGGWQDRYGARDKYL